MKKLLLGALLSFCCGASAQQAVDTVDALNARCEAARQKKLEPLREDKIRRCERSAAQPTAGCRTFYSTYGNNSNHRNGSVVRGRFYNLPECVRARATGKRLLREQNF